ncbi:hypothetical protein [Pedobacter hartonius]|uniref:hypothetical protein n=1 Tax=Pedobacter hartonius TaxID=425514 RepID=UPI0011153B15|nr:hypothetical protein [Pedobacter hartonius]
MGKAQARVQQHNTAQGLEMTKYMKVLEPHRFTFEVPGGCLCIVSMSLKFFNAGTIGWIPLHDKKINPSCICGALITPGTYQQGKLSVGRKWSDLNNFSGWRRSDNILIDGLRYYFCE